MQTTFREMQDWGGRCCSQLRRFSHLPGTPVAVMKLAVSRAQ
ncbi:hypothetical protein RISK_001830 [Rhodopirellula islandica]|uniref:Uncharacterized protein n=1 Tax=Rhodopirellula islandica TaxID=595434 RepID=A0A0J1EKC9_RHOIS|nr:hypothetical protein RISK_001830 [Rhodopirellula islandica]